MSKRDSRDAASVRHDMNIQDAALLVLEAMEGITRARPRATVIARRCHHWALALKPFCQWAVVGLIALTFFELPTWCHANSEQFCRQDMHAIAFVPPKYGYAVETATLTLLITHSILRAIAYGYGKYSFFVLDAALIVYAVDLAVSICNGEPNIRIAPYMRALLLVAYSANLMAQMYLLARILAEFMSILFVILLFLGFSAWFGSVTFGGAERRQYFPDFVESCWTLLVMLTTANFPDLMIPAFEKNRLSALLFIPAVVFGVFVMMNFLLASTYDKYSNGHEELLDRMMTLREENCAAAFNKLDPEGKGIIRPETMEELLVEINVCSGARGADLDRLKEDQRTLLFQLMDHDHDNGVSKNEFKAVITLLQLRFELVAPITFVEKWSPELYYTRTWQRFCRVIRHPYFEYAIDIILVFNSVLLIMESASALSGADVTDDDGSGQNAQDPWIEAEAETYALNSWLAWVYLIEMTLKILVYGWQGYWSSKQNCFDGVITLGGIFTEVLLRTNLVDTHGVSGIMVYFITFRLLRVARLMISIPQMRIIITTFANIAPEAAQFLLLLFLCMFTFCVLGVQLYGGKILPDPDSDTFQKIKDTDYAESNYWSLNFNDMVSGMAILFCLLVVNNWFEFVDAFVVACGNNKWHRWYFVIFYLFGVLVILNVVVAVVLENFVLQWTTRRNQLRGRMHFLDHHASSGDENGGRTATRPDRTEYKVRLASSVKMIEKDEVISRFLKLRGSNESERIVDEDDDDPLAASMRRLFSFFESKRQDAEEERRHLVRGKGRRRKVRYDREDGDGDSHDGDDGVVDEDDAAGGTGTTEC